MAPTSSSFDPTIETTPATLSGGSNSIDPTHPYYIHPSDYPGMNTISIVFDGKSYGRWRRVVIIALSAKNKLGFTDCSLAISVADLDLQKAWSRCNDMVLSWLLNFLSKEIAESVLYSQSAKELWSDLENRFVQTNGAKLFQLQKELNDVVQDFKFTKKRRFQTLANNAHHAVEEVDQAGNGFSNAKTLTQKNIGELLQLLQQLKLVQQSDKNAEATTSANCAGLFNEAAIRDW